MALLYRFFALEALLGDKSSRLKGEQRAFRRATLSHAVTGGFRQPETALQEYLTFARSHDLSRRSQLTRALDTHPDRQQLVDWLRHSGGPRWERFVAKQTTAGAAEAPPD